LGKSWNKKGFFVMNAFYKAANLYGKEREKFDDFACRKGIFKKIIHFIANAEDVKVILYLKQSITV